MKELNIISVEKKLDPVKERNLYFNIIASNLIWMVFHFCVFFFFTFQLKSVAMVGFFLGLGNFFSFLVDISVGVSQKYFKPKTLFVISYIAEIIAMLIFVNFTFQVSDFLNDKLTPDNLGVISSALEFFFSKVYNIIFLVIAAFCYGITKEIQEVTIYSYILNNSNQNQYISLIARKNIYTGIGSLIGLIISGYILSLSPNFIIFLTIFIIFLMIYFTSNFFDNSSKSFNFKDIYNFKIIFQENGLKMVGNDLKNTIIKTVNKVELKSIVNSTKYIFLKPITIKSGFGLGLLIRETKKEFRTTFKVLINTDSAVIIRWAMILIITFGFWDTFASTFLIDFLDGVWKGKGYILLGFIAIPAFGLQDYFSGMSKKFGVYNISNLGIALSGISLFLMGIFINTKSIFIIMALAMTNSIGYAACMTLAQAGFLEAYNKAFAEENNLKEIDANASAAPLRTILNFANVVGLSIGGVILTIFGYRGFFLLFGSCIVYILYWTIKNKINKD